MDGVRLQPLDPLDRTAGVAYVWTANHFWNTVSFRFLFNRYTALLMTSDNGLVDNLSGKTLSETVSVSGLNSTATFVDQNGRSCVPNIASVRLYFESAVSSGSSFPAPGPPTNGLPPSGFYTQFWWSNPVHINLVNDLTGGVPPMSMSASLTMPSQWSDWDGQNGASSPAVTEGFNEAVQHVKSVGLSFGGGCFFANGVTTSDGSGVFHSTFSE